MTSALERMTQRWPMWQAYWAICLKEFRHLARDSNKLRRVVILQIVNFCLVASVDVVLQKTPTVIVDQDRTAESRLLTERIAATHTFEIKYATTSTEQARGHIRAGRARVAIVIPPDFSRQRAAGQDAQILTLVDGSDSNTSTQVTSAVEGVAAQINTEAQREVLDEAAASVVADTFILFNPQRRVALFMLPGLLGVMLAMAYTRLIALSIAGERENGNLERLLMTPMDYRGLILGKLSPLFVIGLLNAIAFTTVVHLAFGMPVTGSVFLLLGAMVLYLLTVLSLGAFISAGAADTGEALQLQMFLTFPSVMLSGFIFPLSSVPKVLLPISYAMPQTHFIEIMRGICLRGSSAADLAPHLVFLAVAPVVFTLGAAYRFKRAIMT